MTSDVQERLVPAIDFGLRTDPADMLRLEVDDITVDLLTGIYSEETKLPQPVRISVRVDMDAPQRFTPDTPLDASKNYIDLRDAVTKGVPRAQHFKLIESIADHVAETLFVQDARVRRVEVKIVKLAISEAGESIGMTLIRHRA
jgi:7,8-dihydroneopterin aldolase/epimerase/oxygenase